MTDIVTPSETAPTPAETLAQINEAIKRLGLDPQAQKAFLRQAINESWPGLPVFSTLQHPQIMEVQTATVGTGLVPIMDINGVPHALMMKAGTHYQGKFYSADPAIPTYMIAGGFINLTTTEATAIMPANPGKGEHPRIGAVRELEEEFVDPDGKPILQLHADLLQPMDTLTLTFPSGERRVVIGFSVDLGEQDIDTVRAHVAKLAGDRDYRHAVRAQTVNPDTGRPEICTAAILPLREIVAGQHNLLYPDQVSLFQRINAHYARMHGRAA